MFTIKEMVSVTKLSHNKYWMCDCGWDNGFEYIACGGCSQRRQIVYDPSIPPPKVVKEAPCKGCKAPNDVGIKICWRCGEKP